MALSTCEAIGLSFGVVSEIELRKNVLDSSRKPRGKWTVLGEGC